MSKGERFYAIRYDDMIDFTGIYNTLYVSREAAENEIAKMELYDYPDEIWEYSVEVFTVA